MGITRSESRAHSGPVRAAGDGPDSGRNGGHHRIRQPQPHARTATAPAAGRWDRQSAAPVRHAFTL